MFTLVKINNYPINYTDKCLLPTVSGANIPYGCALKLKDGALVVAEAFDFPEYISVETAYGDKNCIYVIPVSEEMVFESRLSGPDMVPAGADTAVALLKTDKGTLSVYPSSEGKGKIILIHKNTNTVFVQFKK